MDIEKILQSDDIHAVGRVLSMYSKRRRWMDVLRGVKGSEVPGDLMMRGLAEAELASMKHEPVVSALDALRVDHRLLELAKDTQWRYMMEAREDDDGWDDIAVAAGLVDEDAGLEAVAASGDEIREWYIARITALTETLKAEGDLARAQAVVDDPPADGQE